jgi:hypothetical protein
MPLPEAAIYREHPLDVGGLNQLARCCTATQTREDAIAFLSQPILKRGPDVSVCEACRGPPAFVCSGCLMSTYCSKACQKKRWNDHKRQCYSQHIRRPMKNMESLLVAWWLRDDVFRQKLGLGFFIMRIMSMTVARAYPNNDPYVMTVMSLHVFIQMAFTLMYNPSSQKDVVIFLIASRPKLTSEEQAVLHDFVRSKPELQCFEPET